MEYERQASYRMAMGVLALLLALAVTAGALSVSWLRQSISWSAQESARLEREIERQRQDNENLAARVARIHSPEYLVRHMPAGLRPTADAQVCWLRLEAPPTVPAVEAPARSPLTISFDLALLGSSEGGAAEP